jgi:hypothetical protein
MEHSDTNNYQIACQRYFEFTHKNDEFVSINHPNQYFELSQRILNPNNKSIKMPYIKTEHIKVEITQ